MYKLGDLLAHYQMFHSEFQQDNFITKRAGGTLYGQYKQALRELYGRIGGLRSDYYQYEKLLIEIEELKAKIAAFDKPFKRKKYKFKIAKMQLQLKQKIMRVEEEHRTIVETEREFKRFYSQAVHLRELLEEKYGELTSDVINRLDEDMWLFKTKEAIAIDLVSHGRLLNTTYEMLISLPDPMKKKVFKEMKEGDLLAWYENVDNDYFKNGFEQLSIEDVKQALKKERLLIE